MKYWRIILFPFAWVYSWAIRIRHWLFNRKILSSESFPVSVISVGNISMGGTGKTPFVEYLIRLLIEDYKIATLSRGYGRKTKGFVIGDQFSRYEIVGDEPMQYLKKFKNKITVAVDEKRRHGIKKLMENKRDLDLVLLDDAFQHRYVKPGLSILLTEYHNLYVDDYLFPVGKLRDTIKAARRANIIVVTKTDRVLSPIVRSDIESKLKPGKHQQLLFSYLEYGKLLPLPGMESFKLPSSLSTIILFTGIAYSYPLKDHLYKKCTDLQIIDFPDHHVFKRKDLQRIRAMYDDSFAQKKVVVTTEKDAMRLINSPYLSELTDVPVFYLPVEVKLHNGDEQIFNDQIKSYVEESRRDSKFYKK